MIRLTVKQRIAMLEEIGSLLDSAQTAADRVQRSIEVFGWEGARDVAMAVLPVIEEVETKLWDVGFLRDVAEYLALDETDSLFVWALVGARRNASASLTSLRMACEALRDHDVVECERLLEGAVASSSKAIEDYETAHWAADVATRPPP